MKTENLADAMLAIQAARMAKAMGCPKFAAALLRPYSMFTLLLASKQLASKQLA